MSKNDNAIQYTDKKSYVSKINMQYNAHIKNFACQRMTMQYNEPIRKLHV